MKPVPAISTPWPRGVCAVAAAVLLSACRGSVRPPPEPAPRPLDVPPPVYEVFEREQPMFELADPAGGKTFYVYSLPSGRYVMTVELGRGRRWATAQERTYALDRYAALHARPQEEQDALYARRRQAEYGARTAVDDAELIARMDETLAMWTEQRRAAAAKREAARVAGLPDEEAEADALVADYDRRIEEHELKKMRYTSPEWKAARRPPREGVALPDTTSRELPTPK